MQTDSAILKRAAAARALDYVEQGIKLGIGTGSTVGVFVELLAARVRSGLKISAAATSERTAAQAMRLGVSILPLDRLAPLDLTVDGADEADRDLNLIKGGGGALLREKIVASASRRMVVICDGSKLVQRLGRFSLPVEVTEFGHQVIAGTIAQCLQEHGYSGPTMILRQSDGAVYRTDGGNVIYDCALGAISAPAKLAQELKAITGVVEHGLFLGLATTLVVAHSVEQIEIIERAPNA